MTTTKTMARSQAESVCDKANFAWQGASRWAGDVVADHFTIVVSAGDGFVAMTRNEAREDRGLARIETTVSELSA